jgi:hypothetical protein
MEIALKLLFTRLVTLCTFFIPFLNTVFTSYKKYTVELGYNVIKGT